MLVAEARAYDDIACITNYLQSIADDLVVTSRMNNNLESIAKSLNTLVKILEEKK